MDQSFWNCSLYADARIHGFAVRKEYTPQDTFGWLAIFTDGNRLDIHVSSFDYADKDIRADRLCRVLLDKDGRYCDIPEETDADHYVKSQPQINIAVNAMSFIGA